ncbi:MAG: NAD(P)/FAD-dependent oxidoreductase [Deltaproteobacteria bacterium]|nr:NAD(P)/FAD-dependent oxidoreductase [Deltaproteobacteria bacterium]MBW2398086.1 NAD(P)/FAD-dependent oxidoreductase [Deltaproteobacteria bacterium]MBW2665071.1 NAD(P)/FAD-dependent oxidoreductase [Deltaproteobacteria bacterium]
MSSDTPRICIVGAGMSGLLMAIKLKEAGIESFRIFEKADTVGGTWRENTYPGLTCDVPSFFYSYSFEPNPDWTHRFPPGHEILAYFERVAEKYDLLKYISFNQEVASARYDDGTWSIETAAGETMTADILIAGCGPLHKRLYPEIEGMERFEGAMFHAAAWEHDVELGGKRIGVIGNGSSGIQMMAPLSKVASQLTMFQRTAQWVVPLDNRKYSERQRSRKRRFPILGKLTRRFYQLVYETFSVAVTENGIWRKIIARQCRDNLASVADPDLRRKLTPDYVPMCKRLVISGDFYPTLTKANVELVTDGIQEIEARGVRTIDGTLHELDILVLATGYVPYAWGIDQVVGPEGLSLKQAWAQGSRAYRSVGMPGFPNFFMLVGPNSPIGNVSLIDVSEVQAAYIIQCIDRLREKKTKAMAPTMEATRAFHKSVLSAMDGTVWTTGCSSWYLDEDGVPVTWPWSAARFHKEMRQPDFSDYDLVES